MFVKAILLALLAVNTTYAASVSSPLRILPIGDSITIGDRALGGYRQKLFEDLVSSGYNIEFVGNEGDEDSQHSYTHHEGHKGWTINDLVKYSTQILDRIPDADIILLLIGTHDIINGGGTDVIHRWDELIGRLAELQPFARIFTSTLLPHTNATVNNIINSEFNQFAKNVTNSHKVEGKKVSFVDMNKAVKVNQLVDHMHPNQEGYNEMANTWRKAIETEFNYEGDDYLPSIIRTEGTSDRLQVSITFSKVISTESVDINKFEIENLSIINATLDSKNPRILHLSTSEQTIGGEYEIVVHGGVTATNSAATFTTGWRFLNMADLHLAEKYVFRWDFESIENDVKILKYLKKNYGGDLIMIPGDTNSGAWDRKEIRTRLVNAMGIKLTPEETVREAGRRCYSGMYSSFRKAGYSNLLMTYGDHEAGDNPWKKGSLKSRLQPQFRKTFSENFNRDDNGFKYTSAIGNADSHPIGTDFEETSFAYIHKNVLFVSVDVLFQKSPWEKIAPKSTVAGRVNGDHLAWFDNVLQEGRALPQVKHIFVSGHLPVLYPVRKVKSSGQYMDYGVKSELWKAMLKHDVDIYFSGEHHLNTVTKDHTSNLIQITSRGNYFTNFLSIDVTDDAVDIKCHNEVGNALIGYNYNYEISGQLQLRKLSGETTITASGELALLDTSKAIIHFNFERIVPLKSRQVLGLGDIIGAENVPVVGSVPVDGVTCKDSIPNEGEFGQNYDAQANGITLVKGVHGLAGKFSVKSRAALWAMGPHSEGEVVSYALWFSTLSSGKSILVSYEGIWKRDHVLNLRLRNGTIELCQSNWQKLIPLKYSGKNLNNGKWHHIAMTMPNSNCKLSEVHLYIDGKEIETKVKGNDKPVHVHNGGTLAVGGFGYGGVKAQTKKKRQGFRKGNSFVGRLDDVMIWTRTLDETEIQNLAGVLPSSSPSMDPSSSPSELPSVTASLGPSSKPSDSASPSGIHSSSPSANPSISASPSMDPSAAPI